MNVVPVRDGGIALRLWRKARKATSVKLQPEAVDCVAYSVEDVVDVHITLGHPGLQPAVSGHFVVSIPHNEHVKVMIKELVD